MYDSFSEADALLDSAYRNSLKVASEAGIDTIAFSLISSGIFRGPRPLSSVLEIGLSAVAQSTYPGLKTVAFVGYSHDEVMNLCQIGDRLFEQQADPALGNSTV